MAAPSCSAWLAARAWDCHQSIGSKGYLAFLPMLHPMYALPLLQDKDMEYLKASGGVNGLAKELGGSIERGLVEAAFCMARDARP